MTTGADFARLSEGSGEGEGGEMDDDDSHRPGRRRRVAWELVQLFVLDNVDDLAGKPAAQRELCTVLDTLAAYGGRAIVTARRVPARDDRLSAGLASRLQAGLIVPLGKLSEPARRAMISELAHARGLALSQGAIDRIAGRVKATVPQLTGDLLRLDAAARAAGTVLDEAFVEERLPAAKEGGPSIRAIALRVAEHFGMKVSELRGPARRKEVVAARSVAIYVARRMTGASLQAIGDYFGGRDHATVAYNVEKVEAALSAGEAAACRAVACVREAFDEMHDA
jgi:chromosomal replication initiator protein